MDWTEIAGAIAAGSAVVIPAVWKMWAVAKRIGDRLWERFFGPDGYATRIVNAHLAFVEATGVKLEENDKELDTITLLATKIHENTSEALQHTRATLKHAERADATLNALLETARTVAQNDASPARREEVMKGLNAIKLPKIENGEC